MTKRVAIYCRVSTSDQTLDQQRQPLIDKCKENKWDYEVFEEKISGATTSRTQLDQMMFAIRRKEFDTVLVAKLDRLGRSLKHLINLTEEWNNKDVQFICVSPEIDTTSAQGVFFLQIIGAVAELERSLIRERTQAKLDYLKAQGVRLGRPPGAKDKKKRRVSGYHMRWDHVRKTRRSNFNRQPQQVSSPQQNMNRQQPQVYQEPNGQQVNGYQQDIPQQPNGYPQANDYQQPMAYPPGEYQFPQSQQPPQKQQNKI